MATIGEILVSLKADLAQFSAGMNQARSQIANVEASAKSTELSLNKMAEMANTAKDALIGIVVSHEVVSFIEGAATATKEWAEQLEKFQNLAGLSSQSAATLAASAKITGVQEDVVASAMARVGIVLATHAEKFRALGISVSDAQGRFLPMIEVLRNTIAGLDRFAAGTARTAAAGELFGKQAQAWLTQLEKLGPALNSANWKETSAMVAGLGLATDDAKQKAQEWNDAIGKLRLEFLGFQNVIGNSLLPTLRKLADEIAVYAKNGDLKRWAEEAASGILTLTIALANLAKFIADHNVVFGVLFAAAGAEALKSGQIAKGLALVTAGWEMTGNAGAKAAAQISAAMDKQIADLTRMQNAIHSQGKGDLGSMTISGGDQPPNPAVSKAVEALKLEHDRLTTSLTNEQSKYDELTAAYQKGRQALADATVAVVQHGGAQSVVNSVLAQAQIHAAGVEAQQKLVNAALEKHIALTDADKKKIYDAAAATEQARLESEKWKKATDEQVQATNALITGLARHKEAIDKTKMATDALTGEQKALADEEGRVLQAFQQGTISLQQFEARRRELQSQVDGTTATMKKFGDQVGSSLSSSADNFISVALTAGQAKDAFAAFGQAALSLANDIAKLIIQLLIVEPLIKALKTWLGFDTGTVGGSASSSAPAAASSTGSAASRATITLPQNSFRPADGQLVSFRPNGVTGAIPSRAGGGNLSVSIINAPPGYAAKTATSRDSPGGRDIVIELEERLAGRMRRGSALGREVQNSYGGQLQMTPR